MLKGVTDYLTAVLGIPVKVENMPASEKKRFGWLASFYDLKVGDIQGSRNVFAFAKDSQRYTPVRIAKQFGNFRNMGGTLVFVPRELGPHDVARFVAAKVPYVFPFRSMYMPGMGMCISCKNQVPVVRETFSVAAQLLVCGYLEKRWNDCMSISDGMRYTGLSFSSVVNAFKELDYFGAAVRKRDGHMIILNMKPAHEIWAVCRSRFFNPCKRVVGVEKIPEGAVVAGIDALAKISALNETVATSFAISAKGFRGLNVAEFPPGTAPCQLQLWHYPPTVIGGVSIDPVSLFLSLQSEKDDRVCIELDKLEETFKW